MEIYKNIILVHVFIILFDLKYFISSANTEHDIFKRNSESKYIYFIFTIFVANVNNYK